MSSSTLNLVDLFFTVQGEGKYSGRYALFVRMPFCNLSCSWCDTEFNHYAKFTEEEFLNFAQKEKTRFAVVTGGEPMMNKQTPRVVELLHSVGYYVSCETNGTFPIVPGVDFVTCSPKREQNIPYNVHPDAWPKVDEFKYVVDQEFDFSILDRHDTKDGRRYSLSPEWGNKNASLRKIFDYQQEHPEWLISLQTHKILGVP